MHSHLKRFTARAAIALAVLVMFMAIRFDIAAHLYSGAAAFTTAGCLLHERSTYLKRYAVRKLQIGAGSHNLTGWLNTDIEPAEGQAYLDATTAFPLPDGSMHYVFAEQVIEHLTYEQGLVMLKEGLRVLKSDGRIRIATPNLQRLIDSIGTLTDAANEGLYTAEAPGPLVARNPGQGVVHTKPRTARVWPSVCLFAQDAPGPFARGRISRHHDPRAG